MGVCFKKNFGLKPFKLPKRPFKNCRKNLFCSFGNYNNYDICIQFYTNHISSSDELIIELNDELMIE